MERRSIRAWMDSRSPAAIRRLYTVFAIAVLSVCLFNFIDLMWYKVWSNDQCAWRNIDQRPDGTFDRLLITDVVPGGVADRAGLQNGDTLLAIDGMPLINSSNAMQLINRHAAGEYARYLVGRNGARFEVRVQMLKLFRTTYFAVFLLGFGFLLVGYTVVMIKPEGSIQRKFGRYSILSMLFFGIAQYHYNPAEDPWYKYAVLSAAWYSARVFALPAFVTFFLNFPVRRKVLDAKWFLPILYAGSVLCAIPWMRIFTVGEEDVFIRRLPEFAAYLFYFSGLAVFIHSYFQHVERQRRRQLRPILVTIVIGCPAFIYGLVVSTVDPFSMFLRPTLLLPGLLIIAIPPAFGYAIVKYRVMDVHVFVKRSLLYGIVTAAIASIYLFFVYGIGRWAGIVLGSSDDHVITFLAFILTALLFDPIKRRVQNWIDVVFYRERLNYQKALMAFSRSLPMQINLDQILKSMVDTISSAMHVESIGISLCSLNTGCRTIGRDIPAGFRSLDPSPDGLIAFLRKTKSSWLSMPDDDREAAAINPRDRADLRDAGIVLAVPMLLQDTLIGIILAGPKKSGKPYSQEDIDLLSTVAGQAAIAIENARLHQSELERQKIESQLVIARRIQTGLLPKDHPHLPGLDVSGISIPASTVGGDYFDYIPVDDHRMFVVVADVSGKGIPAALYMSKVQGMIQLAAQTNDSPREILIQVNRRLFDSLERNAFITMVLALFDSEKREVRICRAGHTLPVVGANAHPGFLMSEGIGLGIERGEIFEANLEEVLRTWNPGEYFVFYSDGLTETMDSERREFGEQRLLEIVGSGKHSTARELEDTIIGAVRSYRGEAEQHDDLTLVVVRAIPEPFGPHPVPG